MDALDAHRLQHLEQWRVSVQRSNVIDMLRQLCTRMPNHIDAAEGSATASAAGLTDSASWAALARLPAEAGGLESETDIADMPPFEFVCDDGGQYGVMEEDPMEDGGGRTTLLVHNVPPGCTAEALLRHWPMEGGMDFLYLPMTVGGQRAVGCAFVNFVAPVDAASFRARWHWTRLPDFDSKRPLRVTYAKLQGLETNLLHLKAKSTSRLRSRRCRLLAVWGGMTVGLDELDGLPI